MAARILIRQATVDDLPWMRLLFDRFMAGKPDRYPAHDAEELDHFTVGAYRMLTQHPGFGCWIAWRGKTAVGFLGGAVEERLVGKPHTYANALWAYVEPEYRAGDVGFRLLEAFAGWAQAQGAAMLECQADAGDTRYADAGYPLVSTRYAAPIADVLDNWRGHAYPIQGREERLVSSRILGREETPVTPANGHDTTPDAVTA